MQASSSYNASGDGFEKEPMGQGFGGMINGMKDAIVGTGQADGARVDTIVAAWRRLGAHEGSFFASAAGEAIGWKP